MAFGTSFGKVLEPKLELSWPKLEPSWPKLAPSWPLVTIFIHLTFLYRFSLIFDPPKGGAGENGGRWAAEETPPIDEHLTLNSLLCCSAFEVLQTQPAMPLLHTRGAAGSTTPAATTGRAPRGLWVVGGVVGL